jgi:carboxymethylenebutenolidase
LSGAPLQASVAIMLQELTLDADAQHADPASPAVAALAAGARRGVVVIHEAFGRQPEIDRVVLRFADAGYAAIAPDLFHRGRLRCMWQLVPSIRRGEDSAPLRQARRARAWLCTQADLQPQQVGLIGFCFGGLFALAAGRGWGAVSTNYGELPEAEVMRGIGPVIACYGNRDRRASPEELKRRLAQVGVTPEVHEYPDAGHSFLTDGHHPIASALTWPLFQLGYHEPSAKDAWPKILDFFGRALG